MIAYAKRLSRVDASTVLPWTRMKKHLRLRVDSDQECVETFVEAAVEVLEGCLHRNILQSTWEVAFRSLPCDRVLRLPGGPISTLSEVRYFDGEKELITEGGKVILLENGSALVLEQDTLYTGEYQKMENEVLFYESEPWPPSVTKDTNWQIKVKFTSGYATAEEIPKNLLAGWILKTEQMYDPENGVKDEVIENMTRPHWLPLILNLWPNG